jgi:hypothetical protein
MKKVKPGQFVRIKNRDKKMGAAFYYNQFTVKSQDGNRYETFLATDYELERMKARANKNPEDLVPLLIKPKRTAKFWHWRR